MPIHVELDPGSRVACVTFAGDVRLDDYLHLIRELEGGVAQGAACGILAVTDPDMRLSTPSEVRVIAAALQQSELLCELRVAIVATSTVLYGLARMLALLAGADDTMQVFTMREEAERWLVSGSPDQLRLHAPVHPPVSCAPPSLARYFRAEP